MLLLDALLDLGLLRPISKFLHLAAVLDLLSSELGVFILFIIDSLDFFSNLDDFTVEEAIVLITFSKNIKFWNYFR